MGPGDILTACIVGLMLTPVLAIFLLALYLMTEGGPQTLALHPGMIAIVPQGIWHRFDSPDGVTLMTATPQPTDHPPVHVDDPRTLD